MAGSAPDVPTLSDRELPQSIRNAAEDGDVDWFRALLDRHPGFHVNAAVGAWCTRGIGWPTHSSTATASHLIC